MKTLLLVNLGLLALHAFAGPPAQVQFPPAQVLAPPIPLVYVPEIVPFTDPTVIPATIENQLSPQNLIYLDVRPAFGP